MERLSIIQWCSRYYGNDNTFVVRVVWMTANSQQVTNQIWDFKTFTQQVYWCDSVTVLRDRERESDRGRKKDRGSKRQTDRKRIGQTVWTDKQRYCLIMNNSFLSAWSHLISPKNPQQEVRSCSMEARVPQQTRPLYLTEWLSCNGGCDVMLEWSLRKV